MLWTTGTQIGAYEIVGPLGAGGMGQVYRARDTKLGRAVAIKVILDQFASDAKADISSSGLFVEPFPTTAAKYRISNRGLHPLWSPFQSFGPTAARLYDIMPDGQQFIESVPSGQGLAGVSTHIEIVLNWFEELKQHVPRTK